MAYITFHTIKRTAFDILAYFWPELSGKYLHLNITRMRASVIAETHAHRHNNNQLYFTSYMVQYIGL